MIKQHGQSIVEYAIVAGIIAAVLVAMGPGFRWSVQQVIKSTADAIGFQEGAEQASDPESGYLNRAVSNVQRTATTTRHETHGFYTREDIETTNMQSSSLTNLGEAQE